MQFTPGDKRPRLVASDSNSGDVDVIDQALRHFRFSGVQSWRPSKEGCLIALAVNDGASETATILVVDVRSGALIAEPIAGCDHTSIAWLPDGQGFYYAKSVGDRARAVFLHFLGDHHAESPILERSLPWAYFTLRTDTSGAWLAVSTSDGGRQGNELELLSCAA